MRNLKEKMKKEGGFTLVEMLIVVAIIAILIAVSIPLINNALERAKHATDAANERSAKAEILIQYLSDAGTTITAGTPYYYDAAEGSLKSAATGIVPYGKHKNHDYIKVTISDAGVVTLEWNTGGTDLCGTAKDVAHTTP